MGGVMRHHSAQQLEEHLADLDEGSAACLQPSAFYNVVALPRQELNYTEKILMPLQFWKINDIDDNNDNNDKMTTQLNLS
jgi:hypothetical protein